AVARARSSALRLDQAALAGDALEIAPRVVEPRPHRVHLAAHALGDLLSGQALELEEREDFPLLGRHARQHFADVATRLAGLVGLLRRGRLRLLAAQPERAQRLAHAPLAVPRGDQVGRDAVEPRR